MRAEKALAKAKGAKAAFEAFYKSFSDAAWDDVLLDEAFVGGFKAGQREVASAGLTSAERDHVLTMVDFFDSSGEEEALNPKVLDALRAKMAGKAPKVRVSERLRALMELAHEQAAVCGEPDSAPAQLYALLFQHVRSLPSVYLLWNDRFEGGYATLGEAQRRAMPLKREEGAGPAIDEWHGDQLVSHHFRDSFDAWTWETS